MLAALLAVLLSAGFFGAYEQSLQIPGLRFAPIANAGRTWTAEATGAGERLRITGADVPGFGSPVLVSIEYTAAGRLNRARVSRIFGDPAPPNYRLERSETAGGERLRLTVVDPRALVAARADPTIGAVSRNPESYVFVPASFHGVVERVVPNAPFAVMLVPDPAAAPLCRRLTIHLISPTQTLAPGESVTVSGIIANAQLGNDALGTLATMPTIRPSSIEPADPPVRCSAKV